MSGVQNLSRLLQDNAGESTAPRRSAQNNCITVQCVPRRLMGIWCLGPEKGILEALGVFAAHLPAPFQPFPCSSLEFGDLFVLVFSNIIVF